MRLTPYDRQRIREILGPNPHPRKAVMCETANAQAAALDDLDELDRERAVDLDVLRALTEWWDLRQAEDALAGLRAIVDRARERVSRVSDGR